MLAGTELEVFDDSSEDTVAKNWNPLATDLFGRDKRLRVEHTRVNKVR